MTRLIRDQGPAPNPVRGQSSSEHLEQGVKGMPIHFRGAGQSPALRRTFERRFGLATVQRAFLPA